METRTRLARGTYIGGHHAAALINRHPYKTRGSCYSEFALGISDDISGSKAVRAGRIIEPGLLDEVEEDRGKLRRDLHVVSSENIDGFRYAGTLDGVEVSTGIIHDVTATTTRSHAWSTGVAEYKLLQLQWYMGLIDDMAYSVSRNGIVSDEWTMPVADHAILTVFYRDTGDIDSIPVYRDDRLISDMKFCSRCFIDEHVTPKIPPIECDDDSVKKIYAIASGDEMDATGEMIDAARNYIECRDLEKKWGDSKKESAAFLRSQLRDCNSSRWDTEGSTGSVTWKNSKGKRVVSYETMARDLAGKLGLGFVELCDRYKIEKPGARTLRVNYKGRDDEQKN